MNISRKPITPILLLVFLAVPFTVSATATNDSFMNSVGGILSDLTATTPDNIAAAVSAAVQANPAQGEAIAAKLVSDAIKNNPGLSAADIVAAVIKKNPELAVAVTTAAVKEAPDKAAAITLAAVLAAPKQASAIGTAAIRAAPGQASSILSAFLVAEGATMPTQAYSELMTNNLALQKDVTLAAIAACGGTPACTTSVLDQVKAQTSTATYDAITQQIEKPVSQSY